MTNNPPNGWKRYADYRGSKTFHHEVTGMMIISSYDKSTLIKENEVFLEFEGEDHFDRAVKRSEEIYGLKVRFEMKRVGKFFLDTKLGAGSNAVDIFVGLSFVPYRVEHLPMIDKFEYIGESCLFEYIENGCIAPEYEIVITEHEDGNIDEIIISVILIK